MRKNPNNADKSKREPCNVLLNDSERQSIDDFRFANKFSSRNEAIRVVNFCRALDAGNAIAFQQELENHLGFFDGQIHAVQRVVAGVREYLAALIALVALAVTALAKFSTFDTAIVAGHCEISS